MKGPIGRSVLQASLLACVAYHHAGAAQKLYQVTPRSSNGGAASRGNSINNRGWIAGYSTLPGDQNRHATLWAMQFHAVIWGPEEGRVRPLPPLPGDSSSAATAINDRGQVVGISGTCDQAVGRFSARHAVLWEDGTVNDIGAIGGETWNTPMAINQQGDVVGFASLPGSDPDDPVLHAFFWSRDGGIRDLGTLPGDATSEAHGINDRRQVVGLSCGASDCRAFLWEDGVMTAVPHPSLPALRQSSHVPTHRYRGRLRRRRRPLLSDHLRGRCAASRAARPSRGLDAHGPARRVHEVRLPR
jgi:probable HAF family extracellular repeat protein